SSTGPNRRFQPQSLGRVRDPVRIAEGPTAIDAATQRRHFGFRLRSVDNLQPIGGAWQRPRREDGKRRVFALHTAQTRPTPRFRSLHEVCTQGVPLQVTNDLVEVVFCLHREGKGGKEKVTATNGTRKSLKPLAASVCAPACAVP